MKSTNLNVVSILCVTRVSTLPFFGFDIICFIVFGIIIISFIAFDVDIRRQRRCFLSLSTSFVFFVAFDIIVFRRLFSHFSLLSKSSFSRQFSNPATIFVPTTASHHNIYHHHHHHHQVYWTQNTVRHEDNSETTAPGTIIRNRPKSEHLKVRCCGFQHCSGQGQCTVL